VWCVVVFRLVRTLIWPGGDLLSHALRRSTIGAEGFHGRVRDGIGCGPLAMTTRPGERTVTAGVREQGSKVSKALIPVP
jgi:hypothetical protein